MVVMKMTEAGKLANRKMNELKSKLNLSDRDIEVIWSVASAKSICYVEEGSYGETLIRTVKLDIFARLYGKRIAYGDDFESLIRAILIKKSAENFGERIDAYLVFSARIEETAAADIDLDREYFIIQRDDPKDFEFNYYGITELSMNLGNFGRFSISEKMPELIKKVREIINGGKLKNA